MHGCLTVLLLRLVWTCTMLASHTQQRLKYRRNFHLHMLAWGVWYLPWPLAWYYSLLQHNVTYTYICGWVLHVCMPVGHKCQRCTGGSGLRGTGLHEPASPGEVFTMHIHVDVYAHVHVHVFPCTNPYSYVVEQGEGVWHPGPICFLGPDSKSVSMHWGSTVFPKRTVVAHWCCRHWVSLRVTRHPSLVAMHATIQSAHKLWTSQLRLQCNANDELPLRTLVAISR